MSLSFAIIGCGKIANRHAEQINKVGKLIAACDIVPQKVDEFAKLYNIKPYYNIENLLASEKKIDVVAICTPNGLHAHHSILSLQAGKNVLCEKPLCINVEDGKKMIATATEVGKKLFVVKSARYNPYIIALKKLITENTLGSIFSFNLNCNWNRPAEYFKEPWRGTLNLDGGTLYTQFSHYIDILLWLIGEHKNMSGYRKNLFHKDCIAFEDTGAIALEMKNGAIGTINYSINAFEKNQEISLNIVAENGTIKLGGSYMNEIQYQHPLLINENTLPKINNENDYTFYKGSVSNHDKIYQELAIALQGGKSSITEGLEALKTVAFIEEFYKKNSL